MLVSLLFLVPLLGVSLISTGVLQKYFDSETMEIKYIGLSASLVNILISIVIWILYDFSSNNFQFVQDYDKVSFCDFYFGLDGLSIYFVLVTTIITPIALLSNWSSIKFSIKSYVIIILLLETLLLAVFLLLDIFLFYIFFESILPPAVWLGTSYLNKFPFKQINKVNYPPFQSYMNQYKYTNARPAKWLGKPLLGKIFSTKSIKPAEIYTNADTQKLQILKENQNKSGIYRLINKDTGKSYIGSSVNLSKRFTWYYSFKNINNRASNSLISRALLKYGYSKFRV